MLFVVFFQAEDGIRDLVRSRGLGDVYKRQGKGGRERTLPVSNSALTAIEEYLDIARSQLARGAAQKPDALFLNHRGKRLTLSLIHI